MQAKFAILTVCCLLASGCATVDFGEVTASPDKAAALAPKSNVVKRAASRLYAAFASRGWVTQTSRERVQSTAGVLLRGLDSVSEDGPLNAYAQKVRTFNEFKSDISSAKTHVKNTSKAGEVYLAMASADSPLRDELKSLQKALLVARQAESQFEEALLSLGAPDNTDLVSYSETVDRLRDVTDQFGDRVRQGETYTSAVEYVVN